MLEFEPPRSLIGYIDQKISTYDRPAKAHEELSDIAHELHAKAVSLLGDEEWQPYGGNGISGNKLQLGRRKISEPIIIEGRTVSFKVLQVAPSDLTEGVQTDDATIYINMYIDGDWGKDINLYQFNPKQIRRGDRNVVTEEEYDESQEALDFIERLFKF